MTAPERQLWTEERREAFLNVADRVGWSSHSLIASHLGMTVRQIRNYKSKFPHSRWRVSPVASGGGGQPVVSSPGSGSGTSTVSLSPSPSPAYVLGSDTGGSSLSPSPSPADVLVSDTGGSSLSLPCRRSDDSGRSRPGDSG